VALVEKLSQSHCRTGKHQTYVKGLFADAKNRTLIRHAFQQIDEYMNGPKVDVLVHAAGVPGVLVPLDSVPDSFFDSKKNEALNNNLWGAMITAHEALDYWNISSTSVPSNNVPVIIHLSSEDGMVASPVALYAASKAGK